MWAWGQVLIARSWQGHDGGLVWGLGLAVEVGRGTLLQET